jgi:hypothetical protein
MPAKDWIDKKTLATGLILALVIFALWYGPTIYLSLYPPEETFAYTTGLNAKLRILNGTSGVALTSADSIVVQVFASGVDPFAYKFTGTPSYSGAYVALDSAWVVGGISTGSYILVIYETSTHATCGPVKIAFTVPGTNQESKEVWCDPSTITMYEFPAITVADFDVANLTTSKGAISDVHLTYDGTHEGINGTDTGAYGQGNYWRITYDVTVGSGGTAQQRIDGPIRLYFTRLTEQFTFDQIVVDGTSYTPSEDTSAADDGYSGVYVEITAGWQNSQSHTVQLYLTQYSAEGADAVGNTLTLTIVGQFGCLNTDYRTWTDTTQAVPCKDV